MSTELAKAYEPKEVEDRWARAWIDQKIFAADPESAGEPYSIVIPPPNITGQLHLGHALNNTLQDLLIRFHKMNGRNTLWVPGTDHASIAITEGEAAPPKRVRKAACALRRHRAA